MIFRTIAIGSFPKVLKLYFKPIRFLTYFPFSDNKITTNNNQIQPTNTQQNNLNSINPKTEQGYAYGHYFPQNWSQQYIRKVLDPSLRQIQKVSIVKTNVGQHSGKILIKFTNQKTRKKYIDKYNQDYILTQTQSHRVVILPFQLRTQHDKKQARKDLNLKNPVRVSNMDFDITQHQLRKLAADYGEVTHIQLNERQKGINRGFATVYFEKRIQAVEFVSFIDGFFYRDRKLKAHVIEKPIKKQHKDYLKVPTFTFKANLQLMKRMKSKQYQHGTEQ